MTTYLEGDLGFMGIPSVSDALVGSSGREECCFRDDLRRAARRSETDKLYGDVAWRLTTLPERDVTLAGYIARDDASENGASANEEIHTRSSS
jgi:hypothetical protein